MATAKKPAQARNTAAVTKPDGADKVLRVIAKRDGFRRAGRVFNGEATFIELDDLTDRQYEQLSTEPMLVADLVYRPDQAADKAA
jgi:hypothetical protein